MFVDTFCALFSTFIHNSQSLHCITVLPIKCHLNVTLLLFLPSQKTELSNFMVIGALSESHLIFFVKMAKEIQVIGNLIRITFLI